MKPVYPVAQVLTTRCVTLQPPDGCGVVVVGQNKRLDVWSEDVWTKKFGEEASEDLAGAFALLKR